MSDKRVCAFIFRPSIDVLSVSLAAALPQEPPAPIGPLFKEALLELLPEEVSLETLNSQYLQRHPSSQQAILAAAKVSQKLQAPLEEVENVLFTALGSDAKLDLEVHFFHSLANR